jgi:hypothetical protein
MRRLILAGICGYLVWWIVGIAGFWLLRVCWRDYAAVEPSLAFSLAMLLSRLLVAAACSVCAGLAIGFIARRPSYAPWIVGALMVLQFLPTHYTLWQKFPIWYHSFFLLTLAPLIALGATVALRRHLVASVSASGNPGN